ncbi:cytochrome b/b6 domain-containing protein [Candidatus Albibeggiatoa sp. nov. BB20]|uniref:cytochrome b/b6 domain-containing protein n=1 Tax=Candidatus Albibeggiatoa sp. nov. BB20 TaxID=3162723 RepID=UPI00336585E7
MNISNYQNITKIFVWDIPIRIFHWAIVLLIGLQWWSSYHFDNYALIHQIGGYCILVLVLFRILWGFFGSYHSRFEDFVYPVYRISHYASVMIQLKPPAYVGHNPLGGLSIILLLLCLLVQVVTGLFLTNNNIGIQGALSAWSSAEVSQKMAMVHKINFDILLTLAIIHILAVLFYLIVKRENLVKPMFLGYKELPLSKQELDNIQPFVSVWRAVILLFLSIIGVGLLLIL